MIDEKLPKFGKGIIFKTKLLDSVKVTFILNQLQQVAQEVDRIPKWNEHFKWNIYFQNLPKFVKLGRGINSFDRCVRV